MCMQRELGLIVEGRRDRTGMGTTEKTLRSLGEGGGKCEVQGRGATEVGPRTWYVVGAKFNPSIQEARSPEGHLIPRTVQECG